MSPEDMQRFEVSAAWLNDGTAELDIGCDRCGWWWSPDKDDRASLAEMVQRADEHTEVCR